MTIVRLIQQAKQLEEGAAPDLDLFFVKIPFVEMLYPDGTTGADAFSAQNPPRYIKTHLPIDLWKGHLEKHPNLKVIQTLRNPKDSLVSYYYHLMAEMSSGGFNGTWDQFFEIVKAKKLPWGDFFEVNADWYKFNKDRENSLVLKYEQTKKDPKVQIRKIAKFLGFDLSEKAVDLICQYSTIEEVAKKIVPIESGHRMSVRDRWVGGGTTFPRNRVSGWTPGTKSCSNHWESLLSIPKQFVGFRHPSTVNLYSVNALS